MLLGLPTPFVLLGAALVGAAVLFGSPAAQDLLAAIHGRGDRVGPATTPDDRGVIDDDPQSLADAAGLDLDTYALARMLSSEEGNSPLAVKVAVGWAAVNHAGGAGGIADALLKGRGDTDGRFARQNATTSDGQHAGKYASTGQDPREDDATIAKGITGGQLPDPTGGATNFFNPALQDRLAANSTTGYTKDADTVDAEWRAGGLEPVDVPGASSDNLRFYRRA